MTTDPAVIERIARAWAAKGDDGSPDWEDYIEDVTIALDLARPIIEAEVKSQIMADPWTGLREWQEATRQQIEAEVRERIAAEDGPMFRSVVHECCVVAEAVRQLYEHMCEHVGTEGAPHTDREFVEMLLHVLAATEGITCASCVREEIEKA